MRWKPTIKHSMNRVKELAQKVPQRKQGLPRKMSNNPLTNVHNRLQRKRSTSRVIQVQKANYKKKNQISKMYMKLGKKRSINRAKTVLEVEIQTVDDPFGDDQI